MRNLDDPKMVERYLQLKAQMEEITEQLDEMKGPLLYALMEEDQQKHEALGCEFSIQYRKTWGNYSQSVTRMEQELKLKKKQEQADGVAEVVKHQSILMVKRAKVKAP